MILVRYLAMYEIATSVYRFLGDSHTFYLKLTPEIPDFTDNKEFILSIHLPQREMKIAVSQRNIVEVCAALQQFAFKKGNVVFCWNIKELFTYSRFYTKTAIPCEATLVDLRLIESFLGIDKKIPENFVSAIDRAKIVSKSPSWKKVYNKVYLPLFKEVIPSIEITPLLNIKTGNLVYPHYQISGQANGRNLCSSVYKNSYNPHVMGDDIKAILRPSGYNKLFLYCDYNQMEVSVLQWLSKDLVLKSILDSGKDFYKALHVLLFGSSCKTPEDRQRCKSIFLPVIYGQSSSSLADKIGMDIGIVESIITKLKKVFLVAFSWVEKAIGEDYFGRARDFSDAPYKSRNFRVQSPASIFCLEKLIALWVALRDVEAEIAYHIHDGYGIICRKNNYKEVFSIALKTLEDYSELMPELSIKVSVQIGMKLNKMSPFNEGHKNVQV